MCSMNVHKVQASSNDNWEQVFFFLLFTTVYGIFETKLIFLQNSESAF